jgi:hypothetical protein
MKIKDEMNCYSKTIIGCGLILGMMHEILENFKKRAITLWVAMPNPYQSNINSQDSINSSTKGSSVVTHMDPQLNLTCIFCHKFPNQHWVPILLSLVIHQHLIHWNKIFNL